MTNLKIFDDLGIEIVTLGKRKDKRYEVIKKIGNMYSLNPSIKAEDLTVVYHERLQRYFLVLFKKLFLLKRLIMFFI